VELFGRADTHEIDCDREDKAGPVTADAAAGSTIPEPPEATVKTFDSNHKQDAALVNA
jgi:hypothetical protein